jgi:F-type H+-transporting ATPase subunit a
MNLTSDEIVFWEYGFIKLNATIVTTWAIMLLLVIAAKLITRQFKKRQTRSRGQNILEILVLGIRQQLAEVGLKNPQRYLPFIGTLFIFIAVSSLLSVLPVYMPPTGSLSTTTALALCVFVSIPIFGIWEQGVPGYLKAYIRPTVLMLPFNLIGEVSRTLALAVRLFGNMMSGVMIIAILLTIAPLLFPILMTVLGLITGMVQAYIFSVLTAVYIAAATQAHESAGKKQTRSSAKT